MAIWLALQSGLRPEHRDIAVAPATNGLNSEYDCRLDVRSVNARTVQVTQAFSTFDRVTISWQR